MTFQSAVALSASNNYILHSQPNVTSTFRTYLKPRETGDLQLRFWCSNHVDSTWDDGSVSRANMPGGQWRIEAASWADGGRNPDGSVAEGTQVPITFASETAKLIEPGETFWSDAARIRLPEGHYLAYTWTITTLSEGACLPYNTESLLASAYEAPGSAASQASAASFLPSANRLVLPDYIGYERATNKSLVFLGDSITQGVRTRIDAEEYWVARIARALPGETGVWNIGSGWGRAYDVAGGGAWLNKARWADEIVIALGVNDIGTAGRSAEEVLHDLRSIVEQLREAKPAMRIYMCTIPTFNFSGAQEVAWRQANAAIRGGAIAGADRVFDLAAVLSRPAPDDHLLVDAYMSDPGDAHPNGRAGEAIAEAFLKWYGSK